MRERSIYELRGATRTTAMTAEAIMERALRGQSSWGFSPVLDSFATGDDKHFSRSGGGALPLVCGSRADEAAGSPCARCVAELDKLIAREDPKNSLFYEINLFDAAVFDPVYYKTNNAAE